MPNLTRWTGTVLCISLGVWLGPQAVRPAQAQDVFLIIDDDSIDNGNPPNFFSDRAVNDDLAEIGLREPLPFFAEHDGDRITLHTGEVGDEGWFVLKTIPAVWDDAGPSDDGLHNFLKAGPGLGSPDNKDDREALLDKIPNVTPLRATGLKMLEGRRVCAVVFDGDVGISYGPLSASLKGVTLGTVAFEVLSLTPLTGFSTSSLPKVDVRILDAETICDSSLTLLLEAPVPQSSSVPFDVDPAVISVNEGGVVNGASFAAGGKPTHAAAPGSVVTIFGAGFAYEETSASTVPLPTSLGGVSVTLNGQPAPLLFVGPGQINAQVPWNVLPLGAGSGQVAVVVARNGAPSAPIQAPVQGISPAIFAFEFGGGPAVAINPDGSLAQPAGSIPGLATRPATAGSWITVLATGLGAVDGFIEDGKNSLDRLRETLQQPRVMIGGREARVLFSGLSPQFVAVYQLNVELPLDVAEGDAVPLQLELGSITTSDDVTIALRR